MKPCNKKNRKIKSSKKTKIGVGKSLKYDQYKQKRIRGRTRKKLQEDPKIIKKKNQMKKKA